MSTARSVLRLPLLFASCALAACGAGRSTAGPASTPAPHEKPVLPGAAAPPGLDFDAGAAGSLPAGWRRGATRAKDPLATWSLVADPTAPTPPNVLALTAATHGSTSTYNLCWTDAVRFTDGVLELAFRADQGEDDQGGGPMWRVADEDNYYICRANPLEENFRLYRVKAGERKQLASAKVEVASKTWHKIRVEHVGAHIVCTLDGTTRLEATDESGPPSGGVGLWTKADAATSFDDLRVEPRP